MAFSDHEIAIIKGMLARGDVQSHIAAYFGNSNGGRVSEIHTGNSALGRRASTIPALPASDLPPPGPYFTSGRATIKAVETLTALRDLIDQALTDMEEFAKTARGED